MTFFYKWVENRQKILSNRGQDINSKTKLVNGSEQRLAPETENCKLNIPFFLNNIFSITLENAMGQKSRKNLLLRKNVMSMRKKCIKVDPAAVISQNLSYLKMKS